MDKHAWDVEWEARMSGGGDGMTWLVLIGGAVLTLLGVIKIMANSAKLLIWMMLMLVGIGAMAQVIRQNPTMLDRAGVSAEWSRPIRGFLGVDR
ncbi:MAG: hypothetical protein HQL99_09965 [Magnetococcales bacterium]|nr:hypothetical protein [Magnetococcales bacterium]